jgi:hypothetical protein
MGILMNSGKDVMTTVYTEIRVGRGDGINIMLHKDVPA